MNWMLWSAVVTGLASTLCFAKGAFAIDWSGMVWMFGFCLFGAVTLVLLGCGLLVAQA